MPDILSAVGQAKTVLVFGEGASARAVISTFGASLQTDSGENKLRFTGPVAFEGRTATHLTQVVLPLIREILQGVGVNVPLAEVYVVNPGAASVHDVGVQISGFSADVPAFLALISVSLGLPVPEDVVSTGHIASTGGEIRMVKSLPLKIATAVRDPGIRTFVHPSLDTDISLDVLTPSEKDRVQTAVTDAKRRIRTVAVKDVAGLLMTVFRDDDAVMAALRHGYFYLDKRHEGGNTPIERAIGFLSDDLHRRFWSVLERSFLEGAGRVAQDLLLERVRFHVRQEIYPMGFGNKLFRTFQSLPRSTRRLSISFPLIPIEHCLNLSKLAKAEHFDDVRRLLSAIAGDGLSTEKRVPEAEPVIDLQDDPHLLLDCTLSEIAPETLSAQIGRPIDEARASYVMDSVTVESSEEFYDIVASFYLHLLGHTTCLEQPVDKAKARPDAYALLDRAFSQRGGASGALAEARDGIHGGMRFVLDAVTSQFLKEATEKHVNAVFKEAIGSLDWNKRVTFMAALLDRLRHHLPPEICNEPPERFVDQCEPIVRVYVESLEGVKQLLRAL